LISGLIVAMIRGSFFAHVVAAKPNIVLMALDDLGWGDVGYHGSDFPTPNIDDLAINGVRLEKYYVQQSCSPTRSALMTGRYPFHTGMHMCETLAPGTSAHLPTDQPTLPEALREVGYSTAMIGKWHLGYDSWNHAPTGRGFDSFAGYLQGQVDYVTKQFGVPGKAALNGLDFWRNQSVAKDQVGNYSMDFYMAEAARVLDERDVSKPLFLYFAHQEIHIPLEAPPDQQYADACAKIRATENRNTLCRMTNILDKSIGDFVSMLKSREMWDNTLMWVTTDNGGMAQFQDAFPASASSNYPLRAGKVTLFEGGVRGVSFVTGGLVPPAARGKVVHGLLQHVDATTTLAALGGASLPLADGYDVLNVITQDAKSPRTEVPINVDPGACAVVAPGDEAFSALIRGNWKLIHGKAGIYDSWWSNGDYVRENSTDMSQNVTVNGKATWLFDLGSDPTERANVALANPEVVSEMLSRLDELADPATGFVETQENTPSPLAFPFLHGGVWAPWKKSETMLV